MHPILQALGLELENLPGPEAEILKKILNDHLVAQMSQELMIAKFAGEAISRMHPVARAALLKRISPPPKPVYKVFWEMLGGIHSGTAHIRGICGQCKQDVIFKGHPDYAQHVVWSHCSLGPSKIPESVIQDYSTKHGLKI
jgi:hypothetical protein